MSSGSLQTAFAGPGSPTSSTDPVEASKTAALYIHFPFCEIRCGYCDFYTIAQRDELIPPFLKSLQLEAEINSEKSGFADRKFSTLFFGGGTPSLLSADQLADLMTYFQSRFLFSENPEITLETNPGTVDPAKLTDLRQAGINRISFGVQSFQEHELQFLDRDHTVRDSVGNFENARNAGFSNISLDLIFGLPGQTLAQWRDNLEKAIGLAPEHISAYNLTYETGTPLTQKLQQGLIRLPPEERQRKMQLANIDFLAENGLLQYEISNYAKPDFESQHNQKYWDGSPYLGLGPSAHSFDGKVRFSNIRNTGRYIENLEHGLSPVADKEQLTESQIRFEKIYLGLRQTKGIDIRAFEDETGEQFFGVYRRQLENFFGSEIKRPDLADRLKSGEETLHSDLVRIEDGHLKLTREGILLCDSICSEFVC